MHEEVIDINFMTNSTLKVIFIIYFVCLHDCIAQRIGECSITPEIWNIGVLPKAESSNDLTRNYASFDNAKGKKIIISGKILDSNCVSVDSAKVSIWQADADGKLKFNQENDVQQDDFDRNFKASGSAVTDNNGHFNFVTVYPGKINNINPNIIFRVEHINFLPMETRMFFPEYSNSHDIKKLNAYVENDRIPLLVAKKIGIKNNILLYNFLITLGQTNFYRGY